MAIYGITCIDVRNEDNIVIFDAHNKTYSIEEALQHA